MNISDKKFSYTGPLGLVVEVNENGRIIDDGLIVGNRIHDQKFNASESAADLISNRDDNKVALVRLSIGLTFVSSEEKEKGMYAEVIAWRGEDWSSFSVMDKAQPLRGYIEDKFKTQVAFAKAQDVEPAQVTQWLNKDFIVVNEVLYSPRRNLT